MAKVKKLQASGQNVFLTAFSAVVLGLLAGAVLMLIIGKNPFTGYTFLVRGSLMDLRRIGDTLSTATMLILVGLSVGFSFKTGLFNIGGAGQMLMGGLAATFVAHNLNAPRPVLLAMIVLAGLLAGAAWGIIPGILKARFNVHEVVATIMMNWTAYWIVYYIVPMYLKDPKQETQSMAIPLANSLRMGWLTKIFPNSSINLGIFIAIAAVFIIKFILDKTTLGFELKAVGANRFCAEYAGIKVNRNIIISMMISGILAGLAGVAYYTGYSLNTQIGVMPSQGFDGIAVALLGSSSPIGILMAGLFFGLLQAGKGFMNAMTKVPPEIADTIIAIIIYFTATSTLFLRLFARLAKKRDEKRETQAVASQAGHKEEV